MKTIVRITILCMTIILFTNCNKDDDSSKEDEAIECDQWFEGDPCEAMITKFIGEYVGGAGFCGTNYEYTVIVTPNVVNGISIGIANPGQEIGYFFDAILTSTTEFDIPLQEVEASGQTGTVSGNGNLNEDTLSYLLIVEGEGTCDHVSTRV